MQNDVKLCGPPSFQAAFSSTFPHFFTNFATKKYFSFSAARTFVLSCVLFFLTHYILICRLNNLTFFYTHANIELQIAIEGEKSRHIYGKVVFSH